MGESKQREQKMRPKAHQLSVVTAVLKNGVQIQCFSSQPKNLLVTYLDECLTMNKMFIIPTGNEDDQTKDDEICIPASEIAMVTVAFLKQPSNIVQLDKRIM